MIADGLDLLDVLNLATDQALARVHVSIPGTVTKYDASAQTASVQPNVSHTSQAQDGSTVYTKLPELLGLPVVWPRAGGYYISAPLSVGDEGVILFCSQGIADWRESGGNVDPLDLRRHSLANGIFIPGLFSKPKAPATHPAHMSLGKDSDATKQIHFDGAIKAGGGATAYVAMGPALQSLMSALSTFATSSSIATTAAQIATAAGILKTSLLAISNLTSTNLKAEQ